MKGLWGDGQRGRSMRGENLGLNSDGKESVQVERLWVPNVDHTVFFTF